MTILFKVAYLILTFLSFNSYMARTSIMPYFSAALACFGAAVILYRLTHPGRYIKTRNIILLCLFLLSGLLSLIINYRYGFIEGFEGLIWLSMQYFILYVSDYSVSPEKHRRDLRIFAAAAVICTTIFNIISFVMLFTGYNYRRLVGDLWIFGGLHWGRLWGTYTDPNFGAIISCVAIVLALLLVKASSKPIVRGILYITVLIQGTYVAFSDSRTGLVCLLASVFCLALFGFWKKFKANTAQWIKSLISILVAVCIVGCIFVYEKGVVYGYNKLILAISSSQNSESGEENSMPGIIQRTDTTVTENNVSNGRFDIWRGGLRVFLSTPFVGTSFRNLTGYIEKNMPEIYNASGKYWAFESMHNDFFDVLVGQGIIGFSIFITFVISCAMFIFKRMFKIKDKTICEQINFLFTCILCIGLGMCFVSSVVFINSPLAVLFWTLLGELMYMVHRSSLCQQEEDIQVGILTEHRARNYGSCLQAIALKHATENLGYTTQIVDYRPSFIEDSFGVFIRDLYNQSKGNIRSVIFFCVKTIMRLPFSIKREINFYCFREKYMGLTFDYFSDSEKSRMQHLNHKCYLLGSDQIWNPNITRGICGVYFGKGLNKKSVKASYAASIGIKSLKGWQDEFRKALHTVDFISVREEEAAELISPLTNKAVSVVLDPTLIVEREFWLNLTEKRTIRDSYILVYALELNDHLISVASELSRKKGLPIVFFDLKNRYGTKAISKYASDPCEFLNLMRYADYVLTNSFHGTVFSIIFQKQFLCIPHGTTPGRMINLLDKLDLSVRLSYNIKDILAIDAKIDFASVSKNMDKLKEESLKYLSWILKESCDE